MCYFDWMPVFLMLGGGGGARLDATCIGVAAVCCVLSRGLPCSWMGQGYSLNPESLKITLKMHLNTFFGVVFVEVLTILTWPQC